MFNPVFEEYEGISTSGTSSSLESSQIIAPPGPVQSTQLLDREVPATAPQAFSVPPAPYVAYRNPYASQRNGISINVNSKQINSVDPVSSDIRKMKLNMVNQNVFTLATGPTGSPFGRDIFMSPRTAPPVPPTNTPTYSRAFQGSGVSINVKSKQINSVGLPNFFISDTREKASDMVNQDVPISAPQFAPSVPAVPPPDKIYDYVPAPRNVSSVTAVSPRPNQEHSPPGDAPRMVSPIPNVPSPGQEDLSQDSSRIGSPVQLLSSVRPSPKPSLVQTFLSFSQAPRIASPMSNAAHPNQDVLSLASRRASPTRPIVTLSPVPCEDEENVFFMPIISDSRPRHEEVREAEVREEEVPEEVQENDLAVFSEVPCPDLTQIYEIQESELPAPLRQCSCACLQPCQGNEATLPFVSESYTGPHEFIAALSSSPPAPAVEIISNNVRSEQIQMKSVGLSDLVLSDTRRNKLDVINRLYSLGIQRHIDLPSIVVIGSQSVGKSSLIESISGINLPRSGGACTRCPIECRLVRTTGSEPWQCTVSLRFLTDEHGNPLDLAKNITFGNIIKDPKDVQERLARAQLALLNPLTPPEVLLDSDNQLEHNLIGYSSNIVSIEIRSPDVTDLTFYDLPGLIACVPEGGRDEDVEEIRELVVSYIRKQNCIILLTVACEVDFETQGAYRLAKKCDPEGTRTIGVLTKPDRIPEGEHSRWFKLIRNEISPLQHGWFCVKQLSTVELQKGYSPEKSRHICEKFFNKTVPWNTLDAVLRQERLGTKAVIVKLNELLMSVISERIPDIIQELLKMIQDIRDQIQALPTAFSSNPLFEVVHLVNQFCDTLYNRAEGFDVDSSFFYLGNHLESIRNVQEKFREAICETAPKFQPFARDAYVYPIPSFSSQILKYCDRQLKENIRLPCGSGTEMKTASTLAPGTMYLDDVSAMALRAVTRELPGFYPFRVVQDLVTCYTDKWKIPAINLINDVFQIVTEHQMRLVEFYFEKFTTGGLYHTVKNLVYGYMQTRKKKLEKQIKSLITLESSAFTLNNALFLKYKNERLKEHEKVRQCYVNADKDDFAMTIITSVEAYFRVAYQRFVDNVPLTIDHNLVRIEKISLREVLYKGLELMGPNALEHCSKLMAEDTQLSGSRAELEGRLKELEAIQTELLDSD
ncbi:hypothetical protein Clacol_004834 [Clathrus columnatus]|uniref:Uncharacterized protein n=1 Tax=Clathrus columnatus TaxID=1419009 RepID=A0AAV5A7L2_9AGAM|nr:hypothetical protein Clacol_004834 [Clathrus columnatus]